MVSERTGKPGAGAKPQGDSEKLRLGPSIWIHGCIVVATDGLLTLQSRGTQMIVRNEDVRSKKEVDGRLLVELSPDANIILRSENMVRAGSAQCSCAPAGSGAAPDAAPGSSAMRIGDDSFPDPFFPNYRCRRQWEQVMDCRWVEIGCDRYWICFPEWRQVIICTHEGSGGIA